MTILSARPVPVADSTAKIGVVAPVDDATSGFSPRWMRPAVVERAMAVVDAALVMVSGIGIAAPLDTFLKLLGSAASPCALVCLGMFLAEPRKVEPGDTGRTTLLVALKLFAYPALMLVMARWVIPLEKPLRDAAVLLAALPTGTGPFMLAELHRREGALTARVILVSTVLSVATVTLLLAALR
jgi:predicted permease